MVDPLKSPPWILFANVISGLNEAYEMMQYIHKIFDNTVELGALITIVKILAVFSLPGREGAEVLDSLGDGLVYESLATEQLSDILAKRTPP